jgi:hypothetical protein
VAEEEDILDLLDDGASSASASFGHLTPIDTAAPLSAGASKAQPRATATAGSGEARELTQEKGGGGGAPKGAERRSGVTDTYVPLCTGELVPL